MRPDNADVNHTLTPIDNVMLTDASVKYILFRDRLTISLAVTKCNLNMSYLKFALFTLPNFIHVPVPVAARSKA